MRARRRIKVLLENVWSRRPFGVKVGVMPVLAVSYILSMLDDTETFRNQTFQSDLSEV